MARTATATGKARTYSGPRDCLRARTGRLTLRPNASIEYYKLDERATPERAVVTAFDLTVRSRSSKETAANALFLGYDLIGQEPDAGWMRVELEGGRRQILSGSSATRSRRFGKERRSR